MPGREFERNMGASEVVYSRQAVPQKQSRKAQNKRGKENESSINIQNKNRPTDIENKLIVTKGEREGREKLGVWD